MTQEEVLLPPPAHRLDACCRLCLSGDEPSTNLFPPAGLSTDHNSPLPAAVTNEEEQQQQRQLLIAMILECTSIQITLEEDYPAKVCEKCVETLDKFYQYRRRCLANDQILRLERHRAEGQRKSANHNNNNEEEEEEKEEKERGTGTSLGSVAAPPPPHHHHQHQQRTSPSVMVVPAIRIKREPELPLPPGPDSPQEDDQQRPPTRTGENDAPQLPSATNNPDGGVSSILRSILLQTRESTTSRSSPNNTPTPESPRQTPQLTSQPPPSSGPSYCAPEGEPSQQPEQQTDDEEKDIKPSLLQQMLLQQQQQCSPANRSPVKTADTNCTAVPVGHEAPLSGSSSSSSASSSSLLKRMLLDGSGTGSSAVSGEPPSTGSPLEGPSGQQQPTQQRASTHLRTKQEPPSATSNTPSPPVKDDMLANETTPLASQLRSILLQHRATGWEGTGEPKLTTASSREKPEVSYVRSLFLRNDSDSESEPPPVEDQREMLLYAMFHELRARQQHHHQQQQTGGFSSDSDDDSDELPQDYRLPSVRRRSTDSIESRTKRRRMEYPCLLCGLTFAGRTKLVLHMRSHMMLVDGGGVGADGSTLPGTAGSGVALPLPAVSPALVPGVGLMPNGASSGGGGGASDVEDIAGRGLLSTAHMQQRADDAFGETVGNEDEIDALERRSYACYICGADQNNLAQLKDHLLAAHQDRIRLCAAEGVVIHPLFPPGDNDPKDELVRMIEVLTSVHLAQTDDAGAVICDKCLQLLDLFCKFREESLRQDVLIRSRRALLADQIVRQQQEALLQQQEVLLQQQTYFIPVLQPAQEVKEDAVDGTAPPLETVVPEAIICTPTQPFAESEACKEEEVEDEEAGEPVAIETVPILVTNEPPLQSVAVVSQPLVLLPSQDISHANSIPSTSLSDNTFPMLSLAANLPITVPLRERSTSPTAGTSTPDDDEPVLPGTGKKAPRRRVKRGKAKPNFKKPPPPCEQCQESFATYYELAQHVHRQHAEDKGNRCSLACDPCQMRFTKSYNLKRHLYEVHGELPHGLTVIPCELCGERFLRGNILERHIARVHGTEMKQSKVCAIKSA
uniref:C2H2-type domain-containing protein n=1 Tax=Anopheles epiroticus TaxID=199890 RepID=A0A182PBY3_9DIPT